MRSHDIAPSGASRLCWLASTAFASVLLPFWSPSAAWAQDPVELPSVDVTSTRLVRGPSRAPAPAPAPSQTTTAEPTSSAWTGMNFGGIATGTIITGASSTTITSTDIARSPGLTVQDILAREPGIQTSSLFGGVNGAGTSVDMRGFGATGTSNTLVLINGRRLNDADLAGVDLSTLPRDSIERIEITRGNSGAVLYGDGAVGGVINVITKSGVNLPPSARLQGNAGSYNYYEGNASGNWSSGPFAAAGYGNAIDADGYRQNNRLQQKNAVGDFRWTDGQGTNAYFNLAGDMQRLGLPGGRRVTPTLNLVDLDPRGAATPFDFANKQGVRATLGVTRELAPGTELIIDGGMRQKNQQAAFFCSGCPDFDSGFKATLTNFSLTPRVASQHTLGAMPGKLLAGVDMYDTLYGSDRSQHLGDAPIHRYDLTQRVVGGYFMETIGVLPTTDFGFGARLQWNNTTAHDRLDVSAPGGSIPFAPPTPRGTPLDDSETQYVWHLGLEHRLNQYVAVFGRAARSFRLATVDERVGMAPFGTPTNFNLQTQTSHDVEGGVRIKVGTVTMQSSVYSMWLNDELFFSPATFTTINLDPTHRYGVENIATWQATDSLRFKAGLAYTRSVFRDGPFAGNDVPLVSRWTGSGAVSWNIYKQYLVFDAVARIFGPRRMDNDSANLQVKIPGQTLVDLRIGGEYEKLFWSFSVQNVFDVHYFEYAISALDFFSSLPVPGTYSAYPLPGRTYMAKAGMTW